jgi:triosephosphate isomerase
MLEINKFNKIIAANWKLNGTALFIDEYFKKFNEISIDSNICSIICPPSIYLSDCLSKIGHFYLGSQNCSNYEKGPFTGEISASMLNDLNVQFCLVGHSETRQLFRISDKDVKIKSQNLINRNINPILCIGETLAQKENKLTKEVLYNQVINCMTSNSSNKTTIIAYEPIWAIGSGLTPTLDEIEEIHAFLKNEIKNYTNYKILYGGSVKSTNAKEILSLNSVDGVLVGGASLDPLEFINIAKA